MAPPYRLALVSDIHGNLAALEAVMQDIRRRGVDAVANLGDSVSGPLLPRETAQLLMAQGWVHLAGNHERQLFRPGTTPRGASDAYAHDQLAPAELSWLASLQPRADLRADVLLCHGTPTSDVQYWLETVDPDGAVRAARPHEVEARLGDVAVSLIACGHTHVPRVVRTSRGPLIVNPGSVGLPAYTDSHPVPHAVETGSPDARYAIVENIDGRWVANLIAVPYAHEPMPVLAEARGRPDWACALRTGYVRP